MNSFATQDPETDTRPLWLQRITSSTFILGILLLIFSIGLYFGTEEYPFNFDRSQDFGYFLLAFSFTIIFAIAAMSESFNMSRKRFRIKSRLHRILLLEIFNISAYFLNHLLPIWGSSAVWLQVLLVISNISLLIYALWEEVLPTFVRHILMVIFTVALMFNLYEALFTLPVYPFALVVIWFFLIPLHIFIPAFYVITYLKLLSENFKISRSISTTIISSSIVVCSIIGYVSWRFAEMDALISESFLEQNYPFVSHDLPNWVHAASRMKNDRITEYYLSGTDKYQHLEYGGFMGLLGNTGESSVHDPLFQLAYFIGMNRESSPENRRQIADILWDKRHEKEVQLWRGNHLKTTDIITNVQFYPEFRMAYSEINIAVLNNDDRNQEEAIYSFYLPEGACISSASLWINGIEQRAFITTKEKAQNAYNTIVGREHRDPMLIQWSEGNRISVRVFPCPPHEKRQFKIGITSALKFEKGKLIYENIRVNGPSLKGCRSAVHLIPESEPQHFYSDLTTTREGRIFSSTGKYREQWRFSLEAPPLTNKVFSFNGTSVHIEQDSLREYSRAFKNVYIDLNSAWTKEELYDVVNHASQLNVYAVFHNQIIPINANNADELYRKSRNDHLSIFPFYLIKYPQQSVVLTKHKYIPPLINTIGQCNFTLKTRAFFYQQKKPVKVYSLQKDAGLYFNGLQNFRNIQLEHIHPDELSEIIKRQIFFTNHENDSTLVSRSAGIRFVSSVDSSNYTNAPDHLLRFYAYNTVLRNQAKEYPLKSEKDRMLELAQTAHVVTPITSLVVLETAMDYQRFEIEKPQHSLGNAFLHNSGSVPEPHEWVLIILVGLLTIWMFRRK
ncbi:MAG: XrtN system VIT domain-containing protein [Bacteroidetes bacterium]|nr:XrtN system VIT domain-containing protein [Bacteroidota bacterium]